MVLNCQHPYLKVPKVGRRNVLVLSCFLEKIKIGRTAEIVRRNYLLGRTALAAQHTTDYDAMVQTSISAWLAKSKGALQETIPLSDHFIPVESNQLKSTHQAEAATSSQQQGSKETSAEDETQDDASIIPSRAKNFASKPLPI